MYYFWRYSHVWASVALFDHAFGKLLVAKDLTFLHVEQGACSLSVGSLPGEAISQTMITHVPQCKGSGLGLSGAAGPRVRDSTGRCKYSHCYLQTWLPGTPSTTPTLNSEDKLYRISYTRATYATTKEVNLLATTKPKPSNFDWQLATAFPTRLTTWASWCAIGHVQHYSSSSISVCLLSFIS